MAAKFNGTNGTERLLCDAVVVLAMDIAAFLRQWVVREEGFGSKYKSSFSWEMAQFPKYSEISSRVHSQTWTLWERSDINNIQFFKFYFGLSFMRLLDLFWILTYFIFVRHLYCVKGQHCAPTSDHPPFSRPPKVSCVLFLKSIWFYPVNWILIQ